MARKIYKPEEIVNLLRQVEVAVANGKATPQACKEAGIVEQTYYRWRREYGGLKVDQAKRLKELEQENGKLKRLVANLSLDKQVLEDLAKGKLLSPERRRCAVAHARQEHGRSERNACRLAKQPRGTQRYRPTQHNDEDALTRAIIELASHYGRYGYRRITALLKRDGWQVGKDRVERIWRREGLKVPKKHKPRGRLWLNDGSCVRLRPEHRNHVWSYDFVSARTHDGRSVRMLNLIDESTRECLAIRVARRLRSHDVIDTLADAMVSHGIPEHVRSDNGPEFVARDLRKWLANAGSKTLYIEPGSPWENGYCESFNSKLRDEFLNGEIFYSLKEAQVLAEKWRVHYNTVRPHSSLGYRPPAPETWQTEINTGYGEVESKQRFPLPHTHDCGEISTQLAALH
ncbi:MAG: IS3 family transposase [Acidobacteriaceae bacterium]